MMFTIALLSTISLVHADPGTANALSPAALMLTLVLPMWIFNGLGVLFDAKEQVGTVGYYIYACVVLLWCILVLWDAVRIFPGPQTRNRGLWLLRVMVAVVLSVSLMDSKLRKQFGGTPNTLLFLSISVMAIVCLRQLIRHRINLCELFCSATCTDSTENGITRAVVNCAIPIAFAVTTPVALAFFLDRVTDIAVTPEESRDMNRHCTFLNVFDTHDVWHGLSAMGLALWVLTLLEVRLRIRARQLPDMMDRRRRLQDVDSAVECSAPRSDAQGADRITW